MPVCASIASFNQVSNSGSTNVWEVYVEALIPVLKGLPLVKSLDIDLGYRRSDYKVSGSVDTYKGDLNWNITGGLRFRGGYERAVRAPQSDRAVRRTRGPSPVSTRSIPA